MKCYAVIDTNVVVSALLSVLKDNDLADSVPLKVLLILLGNKNKIKHIFNDEILAEYKDVLSRPVFNIPKSRLGRFLNDIRKAGKAMDEVETDEAMPDPKDVVFYRVTLGGKREQDTYLITGNKKHFPLKEFVVSPSEFLEIVEQNK